VLAAELNDSFLLVDLAQLKLQKQKSGLFDLIPVKWIRHWKNKRDYGLSSVVESEDFLGFVYCNKKDGIYIAERRFLKLTPTSEVLKAINYGKGGEFDLNRDTKYEPATAGSAVASIIDFSCTWVSANEN
jgi:hypothetical protein